MTDAPTPCRRLEFMRIDTLVPALRNPRRHDIDNLRASVERFGFTSPPELDERTGRLVVGHGRVQLLQLEMAAGDPVPEGIEVDTDGVWMVPVLRGWSSTDDVEAEAYLVANNVQGELGGWVNDQYAAMLTDLRASPAGLEGIGVTEHQVVDLLARLAPPPSLADLAAEHGDPDESDLWPVLRFKVPPSVRDAFNTIPRQAGETPDEVFVRLVDLAGGLPA